MGNDGGSIPKRTELVKTAARLPTVSELKATALEALQHDWTHCPISGEKLDMETVVSDWRGRLYNYEPVLAGLANGKDLAERSFDLGQAGIHSTRDVVKVKFNRYKPAGAGSKEIWACPISLKEFGPSTKSVYLVPCGHAFADAAIKQIQEDTCPECSEPFTQQNVIPILSTDAKVIEKLVERVQNLKADGLSHNLKKDKSKEKSRKKRTEAARASGVERVAGDKRKTRDDVELPPPEKHVRVH